MRRTEQRPLQHAPETRCEREKYLQSNGAAAVANAIGREIPMQNILNTFFDFN